jgi:hypothetical protein
MTLRETIKQEIDTLGEAQLSRIAEFVMSIKTHAQQPGDAVPFWQRVTPMERSHDFRTWASRLPKTGVSLSDEAFDRESIYE